MKLISASAALLVSLSKAASYDYKTNGADWPSVSVDNNKCGDPTHQSPIDLPMKVDKDHRISADEDNFQKMYTNQVQDIEVAWNGHTSQIAVNKENQDTQLFDSSASNNYLGGPNRFKGLQFHFHSGSEHTVDGKRHDLEMHTVHVPEQGESREGEHSGVKYAAMGIMFSVNDFNANLDKWQEDIIDEFFESLQWTTSDSNPRVAEVPYGNLMMMVDMTHRWIYKGSVTTPPCDTYVYWNVLRTVYPIKQKYVDQFLSQLARVDGLEATGNWRVIQPNDGSELFVISPRDAEGGNGAIVVLVVIIIIGILANIGFFVWRHKMNKEGEASGNDNNLENTERKDGDKNIELSRNAGQNVFDAGAKDTADQGTIEGKGE